MKKITNASALILSALMLFGCTSNSATGGVGDTTPPSESSVTESKSESSGESSATENSSVIDNTSKESEENLVKNIEGYQTFSYDEDKNEITNITIFTNEGSDYYDIYKVFEPTIENIKEYAYESIVVIDEILDDGGKECVYKNGDIVYICEPYEVTSSYKGKMPFFDQYYQMSRERYETESGELTSGYYEDPWVGLYNTLKEGNGKYIFSVNIPLAMQKGESYLAYIDNSKTPNENDGNIYAKNYHIIFNLEKDKPTVFSTEVGDDEFFSSARCYRYQWKILKEKYGDHFKS